jgi:hypothetical protein
MKIKCLRLIFPCGIIILRINLEGVISMRKLTIEEITKLSSREGVKRIAVENFLMTVTNNPSMVAAIENLKHDSKSYNWNTKTFDAIMDGILLSAEEE